MKEHSKKCASSSGKNCDCDGYHTFTELYEHRIALFIALCKYLQRYYDVHKYKSPVWKSHMHSDGSEIKGWFITGIGYDKDCQITYHLPESKWAETYFIKELEKAPEWDGHTPEEVIRRLSIL
jgi:hypothetical protein